MINNIIIKRILIFTVILALLFSSKAFAQEDSASADNLPRRYFGAYFYPATLILTILMLPDSKDNKDQNYTNEKTEEDNTYFTNIYFTFELNITNPLSVIITPSYQGWNFADVGFEDRGKLNHDRIGGDIGFRIYLKGNPNENGFFIQAIGGMYYFRRNIDYKEDPIESASYSAVLYQGMGYIGYMYDPVCISVGAGYNYYKDKRLTYQYKDEKYDLRKYLAQREFAVDFSIAIRFLGN